MTRRIVRSYTQRIEAAPGVVFPLICPVREAEWLDGWADEYELIYSESGFAEKDCVFRTLGDGESEMIWTISEHDQERGVVEFVRVMTGLVATSLRVSILGNGDATSAVEIVYTVTPTSAAGEAYATRYEGDGFLDSMRWWEASMNHYLRTGALLRAAAAH